MKFQYLKKQSTKSENKRLFYYIQNKDQILMLYIEVNTCSLTQFSRSGRISGLQGLTATSCSTVYDVADDGCFCPPAISRPISYTKMLSQTPTQRERERGRAFSTTITSVSELCLRTQQQRFQGLPRARRPRGEMDNGILVLTHLPFQFFFFFSFLKGKIATLFPKLENNTLWSENFFLFFVSL